MCILNLFRKKEIPKRRLPHLGYNEERIAIFELLLWKNHTQQIPADVFGRLQANGFIAQIGSNGGHSWTDLAIKINREFNDRLDYT